MSEAKALVLPRHTDAVVEVALLEADRLLLERLRVRIRELEIALADATDYAVGRITARAVHGYLVHACRRLGIRVRYHDTRWPA